MMMMKKPPALLIILLVLSTFSIGWIGVAYLRTNDSFVRWRIDKGEHGDSVPVFWRLLKNQSYVFESLVAKKQQSQGPHGATFQQAAQAAQVAYQRSLPKRTTRKQPFAVANWTRQTRGGLSNANREHLARLYGSVDSVFEYGVGESTWIAQHVGVARYTGVDLDAAWITHARRQAPSDYRFFWANVGETAAWGRPLNASLPKSVWNYQVAPLFSELEPFDLYMVDGRWRLACLLLCFLHGAVRVLLHDCQRARYQHANHLLRVRCATDKLCVYRRRDATTDEQLYDLWLQHMQEEA